MKIIKVPGINGLGKTESAKDAPELLFPDPQTQRISLNNHNIQEQQSQIYEQSLALLEKNPQTFFIGGDHSISYPLTKAFLEHSQKTNKEPALIIFDAHADCMPPLQEPTHEEWLRALIENQNFPKQNIAIIGLRQTDPEEDNFITSNNMLINPSKEQLLNLIKNKTLYISIDIDALDPQFAPATYYTESNGLTIKQLTQYLNFIPKNQIKAIDLVEIHSNHPQQELETTLENAKVLINNLTLNPLQITEVA